MGVKWTIQRDLQLLRQMAVDFPTSKSDWEKLAEVLQTEDFPVNYRGAKERWKNTLLVKFRSDTADTLKKSGTEEEYTEFDQLMQDLLDRQADCDTEKENATKRDVQKREQGLKLRAAAVQRLKDQSDKSVEPAELAEPSEKQDASQTESSATPSTGKQSGTATPSSVNSADEIPIKRTRTGPSAATSTSNILSYMRSRDDSLNELRREELKIERERISVLSRQTDLQMQLMQAVIQQLQNAPKDNEATEPK